jgi:hypothetical protein
MDYAQEQADEIEALDSIYTGYFDKLTDAPPYTVSSRRLRALPLLLAAGHSRGVRVRGEAE